MEGTLVRLSRDFAGECLRLSSRLRERGEGYIYSQIGRSGAAVGVILNEAQFAPDPTRLCIQLQLALREANEVCYWLELLRENGFISWLEYAHLCGSCNRLRGLLAAFIETTKRL